MNDEDFLKSYHIKAKSDSMPPVINSEQLGQDILRVFTRTAEPSTVKVYTVKKKVPVLEKKNVYDEATKQMVEVEALTGWRDEEVDIPIEAPPEYAELINQDIARAFLSVDDYDLYLDNGNYCLSLLSFCHRYKLKLKKHFNHFAFMNHMMVVGSGAVEGQRVTLAKTDIAKTIGQTETVQALQDKATKKNMGFIEKIAKNI